MKNYKTIDLFAGIGGIRLGFENLGCETIFASEIDSSAQSMYEVNFNDKPFGDINFISPQDIPNWRVRSSLSDILTKCLKALH
jgi:DNA (cytosine-5)-methyltransferase 1